MRILLLSDVFPPDGVGGDASVVSNMALQYQKNGHEVLVLTAAKDAESAGRAMWQGLPVERTYADYHPRWQSWLGLYNPKALRAVRKVLEEYRPGVVHAHSVSRCLSFYSLVLAKKSGAKVVYTIHDAMLYHYGKARDEGRVRELTLLREFKLGYNPFRRMVVGRVLKSVDTIVAVSESIARANRANGVPVKAIIHNGIDTEAWHVSDALVQEFRNKHLLQEHVILFGGRLSSFKGAFAAVDALSRVVRTVPDAQLLVIGKKNAFAEKMLAHGRSLGVDESIVFTGYITGDELKAAYHASAVVVVPSLYVDPFPTINLEAQACGKPVVATSHGGSQEAIKHGETGFIVDPADTDVFAEKIALLLSDSQRRERFGRAGEALMKDDFTLEKQASAYEELFETVSLS